MLTERMQDALHKQINMEFGSSYSYLAMAAYCELNSHVGSANWFRVQSQEEHAHAMKIYQFLLARGCAVKLLPLPAAVGDFASLPDVFERALEQEQAVSRSIDQLYELAHQEKAFAAIVELQWFITEQVEEEKTVRDIVARMRRVANDPSALIDLDRELGGRQLEAEAKAE